MAKQEGPDEQLLALQNAEAQLLRDKEREEKLRASARERSIRNAQNARSSLLLTAISSTSGSSIAPRGNI